MRKSCEHADTRRIIRIATIIGARPQFIKAALVTHALGRCPHVVETLIHTGQHYDLNMSEMLIEQLKVPKPAYNLGIGSGRHGAQTGRMIERIEEVLLAERPDWVLVYGDTNSTLAGALAASKLHIPIAHVEAGLRSFNKRMPEEINRIVTDRISDLLFTPTDKAMENLTREGTPQESICHVGDVMYDAALYYGSWAESSSRILAELGLTNRAYVLVTLHRAENTDNLEILRPVLEALREISEFIPVVFPVHPRTRKVFIDHELGCISNNRLLFVPAVLYLDMIMLEKNARIVVTDSGGVQKEAFFCRVPCVTLRDETEWVELLELGWNRLTTPQQLCSTVSTLCHDDNVPPPVAFNPYGDGHAAERIAAALNDRSQATAPGVRKSGQKQEGDLRSHSLTTV